MIEAAERAARESYGRLVALLAARTRDVAAAEDALSEAFAAALAAWPKTGVPDNPAAWLFAAARRRLIDAARRRQTAAAGEARLLQSIAEIDSDMEDATRLPDRRLGLLFACAHPALDPGVRTALMLQTVLGLSAERIAAAFLVDPRAMGQRLVRAKTKIRDAGIAFDLPEPAQWPERLPPVLDAIYAAFSEGWTDPLRADAARVDLALEAIWLARVLVAHIPGEPEALGLLALMLHLEARREARRDAESRFVPLDAQDPALWRSDLQSEAERLLRRAAEARRPGRYQLEAAIQSAHAARAERGETDWAAVTMLYQALVALTGSPVARLNRAAALARRDGPAAGLDAIDAIDADLSAYQPFWALKAHLLAEIGAVAEAAGAYDEAITRESDPAVIAFLREKRERTVDPA